MEDEPELVERREVIDHFSNDCVCAMCGRHKIADGLHATCRNCRLKEPALKRQPAPKWRKKKEDDPCQQEQQEP